MRLLLFAMLSYCVIAAGQDLPQQRPPQRIPRQNAEGTGALQGVVKAGTLGLSGAKIRVQSADGRAADTVTGGDGVFRVPDLAPGTFEVSISHDGFANAARTVRVEAGQIAVLDVTMTPAPQASPDVNALPHAQTPPVPDTQSSPYREIVRPPAGPSPGGPPPEGLPAGTLPGDDKVFVPAPDRWRYQFPPNSRDRKGHWYDPFDRNRLKGDAPIFGRTFLNLNFVSTSFVDPRQLPTPSNVPSALPGSSAFFGRYGQLFLSQNFAFTVELFHGDTSFRPPDWRIRITPEENLNYLGTHELGVVNADPTAGTARFDTHLGLQEAFVEVKLADLSSSYDFVSARAGIQSFNSDFRGFIFSDQEPGLRIFGTLDSNRYQFNLAGFAMLEKDTNSGLNTMQFRHQEVYVANLYRQDFLWHGYTIQASMHYDKDDASMQYDRDNFLVRPALVGVFQPHKIRAEYYGVTGDGHIGPLNLTHAFYEVLGNDSLNPIAERPVRINAQMAAAELSVDHNWLRYRASFFYASGDKNPLGRTASGFDSIFDNPDFAGGIFSFWNREGLRLTGSDVSLDSPDSLLPDLRSSKIEGQANFVNPGLFLYNAGVDADVTPRLRAFLNLNLIRFANTESLELILFQQPIRAGVGADSGIGFTYRPKLSENISFTAGYNAFFPFQGFRDIYTGHTLSAVFTSIKFRF
jgi:hypothetical protein